MKTLLTTALMTGCVLLAACDRKTAPPPVATPAQPAPTSPTTADAPVTESSVTPESPEAAVEVVEAYFARIVARDYAGAYALLRNTPLSVVDFAQSFAAYERYNATVGAPGAMEGAAGSSFIQVPVLINGRMKTGESVNQLGQVTLRRVNNVDGSTAEQREWRIEKIELERTAADGVVNG